MLRFSPAAAIWQVALSYYITDRQQLPPDSAFASPEAALADRVRAAFLAGIDYVQLRENDLSARRLLELAGRLNRLPEKKTTRLLVNSRLDIVIVSGVDGIHLRADSLSPPPVRELTGEMTRELTGELVRERATSPLVVGVSCHGEQEVLRAGRDGADYCLLGPVFATPSKPGVRPLGLARFERICRLSAIPVLALGGVNRPKAVGCVRAGAAGIAGIRLYQEAGNLEEVCHYIRSL